MQVSNELIYFKKGYTGFGDFSGDEAALDLDERLEFLRRYSDFQAQINGLKNGSKQAVPQAEVVKALQKVDYDVLPKVRKKLLIKRADASLLPKAEIYDGWKLYTKRAQVKDNAVCFDDEKIRPIPCAAYTFLDGEKLSKILLKVFISSEYKTPQWQGKKRLPSGTATGRILELRSGIDEILKIQFYAGGEAMARIGVPDIYHHRNVLLGEYAFDAWNTLEIELKENSYDVVFNGVKTENLTRTSTLAPDTLFLSGGFQPRGEWKVKPETFTFTDKTVTEFFKPAKEKKTTEEKLGEVKLPYAVGCYKNRDKYLVLQRRFYAPKNGYKRAILTLDSLDPGGFVELNGEKVLETDTFMRERIDVSKYLKQGVNTLRIVVEPRAPEILYPWHRARDSYNGWFCNEVALEFIGESYIEDMDIQTQSAQKGFADITLSLKTQNAAGKTFKIYISSSFPKKGRERLVYTGVAEEQTELSLRVQAQAWTAENPALYTIRAVLENENGIPMDDLNVETGFRTIEQKNGEILLNGEKTLLRGALIMQFLPPYENIGVNHVCPTDEELVWQFCLLKGMNANLARLHMLGYGTNDKRYARFCDRLGMMLVWTTRYIDSVESVEWGAGWQQGDLYAKQVQEVKVHPSIVMWEGSNEYRAHGKDVDWLYDEFLSHVKKVDDTRLLSPCSHLYYGGGVPGDGYYYQDDGKSDMDGNPTNCSSGWLDEKVVRSAHPYYMTLGYGTKWNEFREQSWSAQKSLFESKSHAYLATEIAVTGRHDDTTPECEKYVKNDSYEYGYDKAALGKPLEQEDWKLSQAYQALGAAKAIQFLRLNDVDGIAWCCLTGGANDASYLKPPVDFYGYAKYAYYAMKENYAETVAFNAYTGVVYGEKSALQPCIVGAKAGIRYTLRVRVYDEENMLVDETTYTAIGDEQKITLSTWQPRFEKDGYYRVCYELL